MFALIEFKGVSKVYEDTKVKAINDLNIKIENGEFVFIVGASGAGKSTLLKLIMREEVPTSGTININGFDLNTMRKSKIPYFRRTLGIVFQDFRLIQSMNVYDNVAYAMRVIGARENAIRKRVPYLLGLVGLNSKARMHPNQLSGGEQQRVALARALANNASMIIADEPTGNIDQKMSYEIVDLLNHINADGTTVIMVTHDYHLVKTFNHRVITIKNGELESDYPDASHIDVEPYKIDTVEQVGSYFQGEEDEEFEYLVKTYGVDNGKDKEKKAKKAGDKPAKKAKKAKGEKPVAEKESKEEAAPAEQPAEPAAETAPEVQPEPVKEPEAPAAQDDDIARLLGETPEGGDAE